MEPVFDLCHMTVAEFLARLPTVPWFSTVGQPVADPNVPRIGDWDEWAGPEEETGRIMELSLRHQSWRDTLLAAHPEREAELKALWQQAADAVTSAAADKLPYAPDADAWHVADADEAVHLPGSSAAETYLDIPRIIAAA